MLSHILCLTWFSWKWNIVIKKPCRKPWVLPKGNYTAMGFCRFTPRSPLPHLSKSKALKLLTVLMRQERINEQAQIIQHHSSYKQAVFTTALLPVPTCQHFTENKATVNHKYCHVEQFTTFVSRFVPSAKSSNWIKKYWIIKMKNYTALERGF